mmetsp:Transcript_109583/g.163826  ORF Transcript_109583/g.163826 Transcript_109583/m.163826 type:complete len:81 (-) Transcript_109583:57-299(-)
MRKRMNASTRAVERTSLFLKFVGTSETALSPFSKLIGSQSPYLESLTAEGSAFLCGRAPACKDMQPAVAVRSCVGKHVAR